MKTLVVAALFVLSCAFAGAAGATSPQSSASVLTSSTHAGAKPVALTLKLTYEMQCGNPGRTPLTVHLPEAMTVPDTIAPAAVLLNGRPAASVKTSGSVVTVSLAQKTFLTCDLVGQGTLNIVFQKSAGLGNPKAAGIYGFGVKLGWMHGTPKLRIT